MTAARRWVAGADTFFTWEMIAAVAAGAVVLVSFGSFRVHGDGFYYYYFLRRLLGADEPLGVAYQFGSALWNLPFYLAGAAVDHRAAAIGVASAIALLVTLWLVWRLLAELELPRGPFVLAAAVLGTPVWFYVVYEPSYTHAVDALVLSAAALALALCLRDERLMWPVVLGACAGFLPAVRYANVVLVPVLLGGLALARGARATLVAAGAAAATLAVVGLLPIAAGIEYGDPPPEINGPTADPSFDALVPLKMLVTLQRGLFVWTPLAAVAAVGVVLYLRRGSAQRLVVGTLAVGAVAVLLLHVQWGLAWAAGFSFSQRFLASFVPLYAVGAAEVIRRFGGAAVATVALAVAFSLFVGANVHVGYEGQSEEDGVDDVIGIYFDDRRTLPQLVRYLGDDARDRWRELLP